MTNFSEWKDKEFNCIYKQFKQAQNRQLAREKKQFLRTLKTRTNVQTPNKLDSELHDWRRNYLAGLIYGDTNINVKVPSMSCGGDTKNVKNHTFPRNMIKKYLAEDGHVYGFQMDPRGDEQTDADIWIFRDKKLKKQGQEKAASIFWGFCAHCDNNTFKNADSESLYKKEKQAILEQMYRVLCSTYYMSLDHAVKLKYILKKNDEYSIVTRWKNTFTGKNMGSMGNFFSVLLNKSPWYTTKRQKRLKS